MYEGSIGHILINQDVSLKICIIPFVQHNYTFIITIWLRIPHT